MNRIRTALVAVAVSLAGVAAAGAGIEPPLDPRALPSLVEVWQLQEPVEAILLASGTLYALGEKAVIAVDPATGAVLWRRAVAARECCSSPFGVFGEVVALADGRHLTLFDRASGKSRGEIELPGDVAALVGMPLIAELIGDAGEYSLAVVDVGSVSIAASVGASSSISDLALVADTLVVSRDGSSEGLARFEGYDAKSLTLRWTADYPAYSWFRRHAERLFLSWTGGDCACSNLRPLDPRTGEVGSALPNLPERTWSDSSFAMDFELDEVRSGERPTSGDAVGSFVLLHVDPDTATERWRVTLPGRPRSPVRGPARVAVPVSLGAGRELLAVLKAASGELEQLAYGLPIGSQQLVLADSLLIVQEPGGLHALALDRFGAPERETRSVAAEVERILIGPGGGAGAAQAEPRSQVAELTLLGDQACVEVAKRVGRLAPPSLAAAAVFIQTNRCRGSAQSLAAVLGSMPLTIEEWGWPDWKPPLAVLRALGAVGSATEVPVLERVATDTGVDPSVRAEAWMALVAVGGAGLERALHVLDKEPSPQRSELELPSPLEFLGLIGKAEIEEAVPEAPEEREEYYRRSALRWAARGSALLTLPDGSRIVLYRGSTIGGERDLWLARVDAPGQLSGGPWFSGERLPDDVEDRARLSLQGDLASVMLRDERGQLLFTFDLATVARDSDRDGLSDLVEQRLHLDPAKPDSDADTLLDGVDPAPNAASPRALSVEERRELDLFEQLFRLVLGDRASEDRAAMIVWRDGALEWRGRKGPTLTLPKAGWNEFLEGAGTDGIAHLTLAPRKTVGEGNEETVDESCRPANESESAYDISLFRGGLNAVRYCAVLRPAGTRWLIRQLRITSIS